MQHEITASAPLLDEKGNLREPGYAKRLLPIYRRADIKAPAVRIKEWDYYLGGQRPLCRGADHCRQRATWGWTPSPFCNLMRGGR